jgi:hypothetical protein
MFKKSENSESSKGFLVFRQNSYWSFHSDLWVLVCVLGSLDCSVPIAVDPDEQ